MAKDGGAAKGGVHYSDPWLETGAGNATASQKRNLPRASRAEPFNPQIVVSCGKTRSP